MIIIIPVLLLAMLVVLAGLFMLAKAKKEQLGRTYVIASTVATGFGVLVFVFGITAGILMCCHKACGGKMKCGNQISCPMMKGGGMGHCQQMMGGHGGCEMMNSHGNCKMDQGNCGHGGSSCKMGGMSGKCEMMQMKCEGGDVVKEVIIKKLGEGESGAEVKVEVDKKSK
jgi:hypothetical protein